jgi:hypothetical protein
MPHVPPDRDSAPRSVLAPAVWGVATLPTVAPRHLPMIGVGLGAAAVLLALIDLSAHDVRVGDDMVRAGSSWSRKLHHLGLVVTLNGD